MNEEKAHWHLPEETVAKQTVRRNSLRSSKNPEPGKGKTPRIKPVNLSGELKRLFSDTERAKEELLKKTPIPVPAATPAPDPVVNRQPQKRRPRCMAGEQGADPHSRRRRGSPEKRGASSRKTKWYRSSRKQ
jgi:hypothetical protein